MNEKQELLYKLGKAIRNVGTRERKRHGSEWRFTLPSGIKFIHDDYNHMVIARYPDESEFYFGSCWGGFSGEHVSILHYKATIELIEENYRLTLAE